MEENNFRSGNPEHNHRMENTLTSDPIAGKKQTKLELFKTELVSKEGDTMLENGAIVKVKPEKDQFLSNIFLREKKVPGNFDQS